jgi:adenylate kinase family enzyme
MMQRILVIGSPGSGKSTFSKRLGAITGLDVIHLDREYWRAGWIEPSKDEWLERLGRLLKGDAWIMDGNYSGTMEMRLAACDTAIFLDLPRWLCTWRVLRRRVMYSGHSRPDMAPGCDERIDMEYLKFIKWTWDYPARSRPKVLRLLDNVARSVAVHRLNSDAAAEQFLKRIEEEVKASAA